MNQIGSVICRYTCIKYCSYLSAGSHLPGNLSCWVPSGKLLTNILFLTLLLRLRAHIDGIHCIYTGMERPSNPSTHSRVSAMLSCCLPSTQRLRCSARYSRQRALKIIAEYHIDTMIIAKSSLYAYTPCSTSSRSYTDRKKMREFIQGPTAGHTVPQYPVQLIIPI